MRPDDLIVLWNHAAIKILDVRHHWIKAGEEIRSYRLPASSFFYVTKGNAHVRLDDHSFEAKAFYMLHGGKGALLDIFLAEEDFVYYVILYKAVLALPGRTDMRMLLDSADLFQIPYGLAPVDPLALYDLVVNIHTQWQTPYHLQQFHVKTLFQLFVHRVLQQIHQQGFDPVQPDVVEQVVTYIHEQYGEALTLDLLAERFRYSAKNLSKLFKKQTGYSLIEYVIQVRIEKAKELLLQSDASIQDIAERVGYTDRLYFTRIFKKHTGTSPGSFKERGGYTEGKANRPYQLRRLSIVPRKGLRYIDNDYENHYRIDGKEDLPMFSRKVSMAATLLFCFALILSACSTAGVQSGGENRTQAVSSTETTADKQAEAQAKTRVVSTIKGDIVIPTEPKRIIVDLYLGSFIALNVRPIGTPELNLKNPYFAEALTGVENIGEYESISLEKMMELQPDLIVTGNEAAFEQYRKIAPTVVVPFGQLKNVHEEITYIGDLLGKDAEAKAWLTEYDQRIAIAKEKVSKAISSDATFSIMQDWGKSTGVFGDNFGRGGQAVYQALGQRPPAAVAQKIMEEQSIEVSSELLPTYAGDYIILTSEDRTLEDLKADPLWRTLDAVKKDQVYIWKKDRSWYFDPIATLSQTEELTDWLVGLKKN